MRTWFAPELCIAGLMHGVTGKVCPSRRLTPKTIDAHDRRIGLETHRCPLLRRQTPTPTTGISTSTPSATAPPTSAATRTSSRISALALRGWAPPPLHRVPVHRPALPPQCLSCGPPPRLTSQERLRLRMARRTQSLAARCVRPRQARGSRITVNRASCSGNSESSDDRRLPSRPRQHAAAETAARESQWFVMTSVPCETGPMRPSRRAEAAWHDADLSRRR